MLLPKAPQFDRYLLFLSSSDEKEMRALRRRVQLLLEEVINPNLRDEYPEARVALDIYMWERAAASRAHGDSVNERFVEKVRESQLAVVMLLNELRPGDARGVRRCTRCRFARRLGSRLYAVVAQPLPSKAASAIGG